MAGWQKKERKKKQQSKNERGCNILEHVFLCDFAVYGHLLYYYIDRKRIVEYIGVLFGLGWFGLL